MAVPFEVIYCLYTVTSRAPLSGYRILETDWPEILESLRVVYTLRCRSRVPVLRYLSPRRPPELYIPLNTAGDKADMTKALRIEKWSDAGTQQQRYWYCWKESMPVDPYPALDEQFDAQLAYAVKFAFSRSRCGQRRSHRIA